MQDLDELLSKATESLTKAKESEIPLKESETLNSIHASDNFYFESSQKSKGLLLLKQVSVKLSKPISQEKKSKVKTAGPDWFNMPAVEMTDEIKKDLHILKSRQVLDPKRHYRKEKLATSPFIQVGTVIQGPTEYYSSRLLKKERRNNIVQELLADSQSKSYFKKKYLEIQDKKSKFTKRKLGYRRKGRRSD